MNAFKINKEYLQSHLLVLQDGICPATETLQLVKLGFLLTENSFKGKQNESVLQLLRITRGTQALLFSFYFHRHLLR